MILVETFDYKTKFEEESKMFIWDAFFVSYTKYLKMT